MRTKIGAALVAVLLAGGCAEDAPTVLKVVVGSDYSGLKEVRVRLLDGHGDPLDEVLFDVAYEGLPFSFSVAPPNQEDFGPPPSLTFEAVGSDMTTAFEREVQFSGQAIEGQTLYVYLPAMCESLECPSDQTCSELGCVDPYVPDAEMMVTKDGDELSAVCVPGEAWCRSDGHAVERCVGFGQPSEYEDCDDGQVCAGDPLGCVPDGTSTGTDKVTLHVDVKGGGYGQVVLQGRDLMCDGSCTFELPRGSNLELSATPGGDDYFLSWSGACYGAEATCALTMTDEHWVEARFEPNGTVVTHAVDVFADGGGAGRVYDSDGTFDCSGTGCSAHADVSHGMVLTVYAEPSSGSVFVGWQGVCYGIQDNFCTFSVDYDLEVRPRFEAQPTEVPRFDLNGDGFADAVYSAPGAPSGTGMAAAGRVHVRFGPLVPGYWLAGEGERTWEGGQMGEELGRAFEVADMDGNAIDDLVIGAPGYSGKKGAVYAIFGGPGLIGSQSLETHSTRLEGRRDGELFGVSLTARADLDGDGTPDLVVGAPGDDSMRGVVYVYLSQAFNQSGTPQPTLTIAGDQVGDRFGWSVSSVGDLDGDGSDELLVGAPRYDVASLVDTGRAYLFKFDTQLSSSAGAEAVVSGVNPNSLLGFSVAGLGDWQGDGRREWAVSSHVQDQVLVFTGLPSRTNLTPVAADYTLRGIGFFGAALSGGEDYTGDGRPDLVVGAPIANPSSTQGTGGQVRLFAGGGPIDAPAFQVDGACVQANECTSESVGYTVGPVGDLDLDGLVELGVGSRLGGGTSGPVDHGRILVFDVNRPERPVNASVWDAQWFIEGDAYDGGVCAGLSGGPAYWPSAADPAPM